MPSTDPDSSAPRPMEPDRARGILNSLLGDLPGVVYRRRNDSDRTMLDVTANVEQLTGYPAATLLEGSAVTYVGLIHSDDRTQVRDAVQEAVETGSSFRVTYRLRTRSGKVRWVLDQGRPVEQDGEVVLTGYLQDITGPFSRRLAESSSELVETRRQREPEAERMSETDRLLRQTVSSIQEAVLVVGKYGESRAIQAVNDAAETIFGYSREELVGRSTEMLHPDRESFRRFAEVGDPFLEEEGVFRSSFPLKRKDGTVFDAEQTVTLLDREAGVEGGVVSVVRDVSARIRAEARLRESEERFRQIAEHIDNVFWISSPENDEVEYVSPAYREVWGRPPEELYEDPADWIRHIHPEDRQRVIDALPGQVDGSYEEEYRIVRPDGEIRWIWDRAFPVKDGEGEVYRIVGVAEDVTDRVELEERLRHAQRMEAVGRLAGGIAHDFNNLLTVVRAQSDLVLMELERESDLAEEIELIRDTADRAAELTRQLLAFSREQVMRPRVVDLNGIVAGVDPLLRRVLGEDVRIETRLDGELPFVYADPAQMEHVLMNLAVNARDAMPDGGTLRIATAAEELGPEDAAVLPGVAPGTQVRLEVADEGEGMDAETLEQVFDPFFTTKEKSGGTGLGLATVYGIVQQSQGRIEVESEPGEGTVFTIWLPAAEGEPEEVDETIRREGPEGTASGRILVIEDDENVRAVARKILERGGFDVRVADDVETGLEILGDEGGELDLVLTDLVLPGMGGRELAEILEAGYPDVGLIVMSGYAEGSPGSRKDLPPEIAFIEKPFTPDSLLGAVRDELEGR